MPFICTKELAESIENRLELLGVTGIEDKLQLGVPAPGTVKTTKLELEKAQDAIEKLREAWCLYLLRIWQVSMSRCSSSYDICYQLVSYIMNK